MTQFDKDYETVLSILGKHPLDSSKCKLSLYSKNGLIHSKNFSIEANKNFIIDNKYCKKNNISNDNIIWYSIESEAQNLQGFTVLASKSSGVSSGEHNF